MNLEKKKKILHAYIIKNESSKKKKLLHAYIIKN